ncbi:hypothetical protein [Streptomyces sp. NPDC046805]|uniref:hypothetical protein n=1 Tax=Streptomyces sp. NPDC046805 TaxID=3155134 RepID=UPI0033D831B3
MKARRARRLFAVSAVGVLMASGAAIGAAGTASAAPQSVPSNHNHFCGRGGFNGCYSGFYGFNSGFNNGFNNGFGNGFYSNGFGSSVVVIVVP